jgi:hypothetical protein
MVWCPVGMARSARMPCALQLPYYPRISTAFLILAPVESSISLTHVTKVRNSSGERDAAWYVPGIPLSSVRRFSMIVAPLATAARLM